MGLADLNARWLDVWSAKDVEGLMTFYDDDVTYFDAQNPRGITGKPALRAYLERLFSEIPEVTYEPEELWEISDGFCARWYGSIAAGGEKLKAFRGFDLVILRNGLIVHNEVYTHQLTAA